MHYDMKFIVAFFFFKGLVQSCKKSQRKKKLLQCYRAKRIKLQLYGKYYKMFASKNDRSNRTARLEFDRPGHYLPCKLAKEPQPQLIMTTSPLTKRK